VFRQPVFFAELLDGQTAALLLGDPFTPPIRSAGLSYGGGFGHDTNLRRSPPVGKRGSSDAY